MEKITARVQPVDATLEGFATDVSIQHASTDVRALDEWELALVGGGEDIVCW
jgi:hypothetical protein